MTKIRYMAFAYHNEHWPHTFGPDAADFQKGTTRYADRVVRAVVDETDSFLANSDPIQIPPPIETEPS